MSEYEKLPAEFKAKWVAALRSGEYRQGRKCLKVKDDYCCLGVAADLCGVNLDQCGSAGYILRQHAIAGIEVPAAILADDCDNPTNAQRKLYVMNDDGKTFPEIADWIEVNL